MIARQLFLLTIILCLFAACDLDGFLFNDKKIKSYKLPGNTIPDHLIEQVTFKSDGNTLYGYWVISDGRRPDFTILYCHGNKHNIDEYWDRVMLLHKLGVNVFIFDYRGYGLSSGKSSEAGLYRDGESAFQFIRSNYGVTDRSLCIYGYSLGNVVSIYLAAGKSDPVCLIAESPFASANSLIQGSILLDIPTRWLTEGEFNNAERIRHINTPFLIIHGAKDDFVRYRDNGKVVFENAPEPKSLVLVSDANHANIPEIIGEDEYLKVVRNWIDFGRDNP